MALVSLEMMIYALAILSCANITIMYPLKSGSSLLVVGSSFAVPISINIMTVENRLFPDVVRLHLDQSTCVQR